jgi:RNA polymerase sigma-70 factor (ECF subfamily)
VDDDGVLLQRVRAGDQEAFAVLVRRYQPQLLRLAQTFVASRAVAEEVVQDTWVGVVRGVERFEGRSSFKTWLFRILVNRARTTGGREARTISLGPDTDLADRFDRTGAWSTPPSVWAEDAENRIDAQTMAAKIKESLHELPAGQREVLVLRDVDGLQAADVCELLGITDSNQRVLLHRARTRVRGILEREMGAV